MNQNLTSTPPRSTQNVASLIAPRRSTSDIPMSVHLSCYYLSRGIPGLTGLSDPSIGDCPLRAKCQNCASCKSICDILTIRQNRPKTVRVPFDKSNTRIERQRSWHPKRLTSPNKSDWKTRKRTRSLTDRFTPTIIKTRRWADVAIVMQV